MKQKPLSPHLSIYKPQITSITSILHRITGVAIYFGLVFGIIYVAMISYNQNTLEQEHQFVCASCQIFAFIKNSFICIIVFGFSFSVIYHALNGIKYLFWAMSKGLDVKTSAIIAYVVISATIILSTFVSYNIIKLIM
jgi:succinate dehydrogenase / fumarate reductase cytochrome b subunit